MCVDLEKRTRQKLKIESDSRSQRLILMRLSRNSSQVHLTDVVEVSMWDFFLRRQLFHLIQQDVHLKLGAKILQTTIAEGLSVAK